MFLEVWIADSINQEPSVVYININLSEANNLGHGQCKCKSIRK